MYPILFKIGSWPIHMFGVMLAIGILVGSSLLVKEAKRLGDPQITEERLQRLIWYMVLAVVIGGRVQHIIVNWDGEYSRRPFLDVFKIWEGGLAFYSGFIAVFIVTLIFAKRNKISMLRLCDLVAPCAFVGQAFGRIGCFMAGDDYGRPTDSWIGVTFTHPDTLVPVEVDDVRYRGVPLHPVQLYMSAKAIIIALTLFWLSRRKKFDGQVAAVALMMYAVLRSIVEFFRGDADRGFVGPLSTSQFISLFVFATGLLIYVLAPRIPPKYTFRKPAPAPARPAAA